MSVFVVEVNVECAYLYDSVSGSVKAKRSFYLKLPIYG